MSSKSYLKQLLDTALGSYESGGFDYSALHKLLQLMLEHLNTIENESSASTSQEKSSDQKDKPNQSSELENKSKAQNESTIEPPVNNAEIFVPDSYESQSSDVSSTNEEEEPADQQSEKILQNKDSTKTLSIQIENDVNIVETGSFENINGDFYYKSKRSEHNIQNIIQYTPEEILAYIKEHFSLYGGLITGDQLNEYDLNARRSLTKFKTTIFKKLSIVGRSVCELEKIIKRMNDSIEDLIDSNETWLKSVDKLSSDIEILKVKAHQLKDCVCHLNKDRMMVKRNIEALYERNEYIRMVKLDREEFDLEMLNMKHDVQGGRGVLCDELIEFKDEVSSMVDNARRDLVQADKCHEKEVDGLKEFVTRKVDQCDLETLRLEFDMKWKLILQDLCCLKNCFENLRKCSEDVEHVCDKIDEHDETLKVVDPAELFCPRGSDGAPFMVQGTDRRMYLGGKLFKKQNSL